jgi:hypothetical protein
MPRHSRPTGARWPARRRWQTSQQETEEAWAIMSQLTLYVQILIMTLLVVFGMVGTMLQAQYMLGGNGMLKDRSPIDVRIFTWWRRSGPILITIFLLFVWLHG